MRLYYSLTQEDYVNFNLCHIESDRALKKSMGIQRFGIGATFLLMPFIMSAITGINFKLFMAVFGAVSVLWIIFYKAIFKKIMQRGVKKMLKKDKDCFLLGERILEFENGKIKRITEENEEEFELSKVLKVIIRIDSIYIYINTIEAYIIPFRAFKTDSEKEMFVKFVRGMNVETVCL